MNIPNQYSSIIDGLYNKTINKKAIWEPTSGDDTYLIYFKSFALSILRSFDQQDGEYFIRVDLINNNGSKIDSFFTSESEADWEKLSSLHDAAKRAALSIDVAIETITEELNNDSIIGKRRNIRKEKKDTDDIPF